MSHKLLLADDSITIRKVVGIIFANEDYALSVVDNGNAALEKAREILPDIIMADVMMPGKTGYDVCSEVRSDPALKHIPLLLLTGAFEPFDEEKARQSGADDFISKPFESQQLIEKVKRLIAIGKERKVSRPAPEPEAIAEPPIPAEHLISPPPAAPSLVSPPPAAPAVEDMGAVFPQFDEPLEKAPPALQPEASPVVEEVVEALPEDDLWDVFALEEEVEEETAVAETPHEEEVAKPFEVLESEEEISIFAGEEAIPFAAEPASAAAPSQVSRDADTTDQFAVVEEEQPLTGQVIGEAFEFTIGDEEETAFVSGSDEAPSTARIGIPEYELQFEPEEESLPLTPSADTPDMGGVFEFTTKQETQAIFVSGQEEPPPMPVSASPEVDLQFAPEEEYVPVIPPEAPPAPPLQAAAPAALQPAAAQPATAGAPALGDEQLAAAVASISREIIERIVWEVVPDLAETLIREEIRKLKEGLRR